MINGVFYSILPAPLRYYSAPKSLYKTYCFVCKMTEIQTKLGNNPYEQKGLVKETEYKRRTYTQQWGLYYSARRNEKLAFLEILKNVVDYLDFEEDYKGNGRPSAMIKDIVKALCIKAYSNLSNWNVESELIIAKGLGVIEKVYKRSTLSKYVNDKRITAVLDNLFKTIAQPLSVIEDVVAIDATGMSNMYGQKKWVEVKLNYQLHKRYVKLHLLCGVKTHVVFNVAVTDSRIGDTSMFKKLVTGLRFQPKEILADAGYLSRDNVSTSNSLNITPYIMPKKNVTTKSLGCVGWGRMIRYFREHPLIFRAHYHQRSNVESYFSAFKRRFVDYIRAKGHVGQMNELLSRIVCLNCISLAGAMLLYKEIEPKFL